MTPPLSTFSSQVKLQRRMAHWAGPSCLRSAHCSRCWWRRKLTPTPAHGLTSCTDSLQRTAARLAWMAPPWPPQATYQGTLGTQRRGWVWLQPQDFINKFVKWTLEKTKSWLVAQIGKCFLRLCVWGVCWDFRGITWSNIISLNMTAAVNTAMINLFFVEWEVKYKRMCHFQRGLRVNMKLMSGSLYSL